MLDSILFRSKEVETTFRVFSQLTPSCSCFSRQCTTASKFLLLQKPLILTGADPGFPIAGGANPRGRGAPTYDFAKFSKELHEIEKILGQGRPPWIRH